MTSQLKLICGTDEAGRGPLAGPVVAAAAVFPEGYINPRFQDSKKLSAKTREALYTEIIAEAKDYAIVAVGHQRIHQLNIREASRVAMALAVKRVTADHVLVDGNVSIETSLPQTTIVQGDALRVEISAASILAKVWRDRLMAILDAKYPGYNLGDHAGYPTKSHREAVARIGPSRIHRRDFRGVKEYWGLYASKGTDEIHQQL
jgi:ribonuclease HII